MSIDTNAAQFERLGNPWVSERERHEFSRGESRKIRRAVPEKAPNLAVFEEPNAGPIVKRPHLHPEHVREHNRHVGDIRKRLIAMRGGSRAVEGLKARPERPVIVLAPNANCESRPLSAEERALNIAQKAARDARIAEASAKRHAIACAKRREAHLARTLANVEGFANAMAAAFAE